MKQGFLYPKKNIKETLKSRINGGFRPFAEMKKSQPPKGISIKMFKKKTGGKRVNCFLYIVHRAPEKMSKMFAKKVSKEGAKGHFAKIDPVFMRVPSKFRYFLATDWQHFLQYPLNKIIFL